MNKYSSKTQRTANQELKIIQEAITSAKELILKAFLLAKVHSKQ